MTINNIADLESKSWYRLLKLLYIGTFICTELFVLFGIVISVGGVFVGETGMGGVIILLFLIGIIVIPILFYIIKHSFLYILLGSWKPDKE